MTQTEKEQLRKELNEMIDYRLQQIPTEPSPKMDGLGYMEWEDFEWCAYAYTPEAKGAV